MQNVGIEIARLRRKAGMSQAELALRLETTQSAVSRLESGRLSPSVEMVERVAAAIGLPLTLTFGAQETADERAARVRAFLGAYRFNPYDRDPSTPEIKSLKRDGLTREHFASEAAAD